MLKLSEIVNNDKNFKHTNNHFGQWNLDMLDLENMEDADCIEALNDSIFKCHFDRCVDLNFSLMLYSLLHK